MIAITHDSGHCQCSRCERWNRGERWIERALICGVVAFVVYLAVYVIRWIEAGFPGSMRIG